MSAVPIGARGAVVPVRTGPSPKRRPRASVVPLSPRWLRTRRLGVQHHGAGYSLPGYSIDTGRCNADPVPKRSLLWCSVVSDCNQSDAPMASTDDEGRGTESTVRASITFTQENYAIWKAWRAPRKSRSPGLALIGLAPHSGPYASWSRLILNVSPPTRMARSPDSMRMVNGGNDCGALSITASIGAWT